MTRRRTKTPDPLFDTIALFGHRMPGIWRYMLPEDFQWLRLPEERRAVCDACPKVVVGAYRADCRCCTYFPHLANFAIGLGLLDDNTRPRMQRLIEDGHTLPEGTLITPGRLKRTTDLYSRERFGREPTLICPLIDPETGACGIYPYRNSICATFFCETDHGDAGTQYWDRVQWFVGQVETALAQWCMTEAGIALNTYIETLDSMHDEIETLTDPANGGWSVLARKRLFGAYFGREIDFFERCATLVMDHRDRLYDIACEQPLRMAFDYERAVERTLPSEQLAEIQALPKNPGKPVRISDLWYQLQLANRRLFELPYNEALVSLHPSVRVLKNQAADPIAALYSDKPFYIQVPCREAGEKNARLFLSANEASALRLFSVPQIIGEALLERDELTRLGDAKGFLAECMRREILLASALP